MADYQDQVDKIKSNEKDIAQFQSDTAILNQRIKDVQHDIDKIEHTINYQNELIGGIDNQEKQKLEQGQLKEQEERDQINKIHQEYKDSIKLELKMFLDKFLHSKTQEVIDRQFSTIIKSELDAVTVYYIKQNPTIELKVQKKSSIDYKNQAYVQNFSITKKTSFDDLFNSINKYWANQIKENSLNQKNYKLRLFDMNLCNLQFLGSTKVEHFFSQNKDQFKQAELILTNLHCQQEDILMRQQQTIRISGESEAQPPGQTNLEDGTTNSKKQKLRQIFKNFPKILPGLDKYQKDSFKPQADDQQSKTTIKKIILKFTLTVIILTLLVYTIFKQRDFFFLSEVKLDFSNQYDFSGQLSFQGIYNEVLTKFYFIEVVDTIEEKEIQNQDGTITKVETIIGSEEQLKYIDRIVVGKIRVLQAKTKESSCFETFNIEQKCSHSDYDKENIEKSNLDNSGRDFTIYRNKKYTKFGSYEYDQTEYDGSGYVLDIDPYQTKQQLEIQIQELQDANWLDFRTKLIVINTLFYDLGRHQFQTFDLIFEVQESGSITEYFSFYLVDPYDHTSSKSTILLRTDMVIFALIILSSGGSVVTEIYYKCKHVYNLKKKKSKKKKQWKLIDHLGMFIDFTLLINMFSLSVAYFIIEVYIIKPEQSTNQIVNSKQYESMIQYGIIQERALKFKAIQFVIMATQLIQSFQLIDKVQLVIRIFQTAAKQLVQIVIFLTAMIGAFTIIYQYIFGSRLTEYQTFSRSFYSFSYMYFFGDYEIKKKMEKSNPDTFLVISFITLITVFFGMISIFHSIMHESYRLMEDRTDIYEEIGEIKKKGRQAIAHFLSCQYFRKNADNNENKQGQDQ